MAAPKHILNIIPSPGKENDWDYDKAIENHDVRARVALPETVDLREPWWKISNQGPTGSCVGWSTADGVLRWHFTKKRKIKPGELLSVRFIWMSAKETDEFTNAPTTFLEDTGTSLKSALDIARKFGCVKEDVLPFGSAKLYPGDEEEFYKLAGKMKIAAYYNLAKNNVDKIQTWKKWLAAGKGPILACLDVDRTWNNALQTKGKLDKYYPKSVKGGHAICIVGYTPDRIIIRNSWGTKEWGDKGFAYASYDYARAAFNEAYGVTLP